MIVKQQVKNLLNLRKQIKTAPKDKVGVLEIEAAQLAKEIGAELLQGFSERKGFGRHKK